MYIYTYYGSSVTECCTIMFYSSPEKTDHWIWIRPLNSHHSFSFTLGTGGMFAIRNYTARCHKSYTLVLCTKYTSLECHRHLVSLVRNAAEAVWKISIGPEIYLTNMNKQNVVSTWNLSPNKWRHLVHYITKSIWALYWILVLRNSNRQNNLTFNLVAVFELLIVLHEKLWNSKVLNWLLGQTVFYQF